MRVIIGDDLNDQEIIRRRATAVVAQWNGLDQTTKEGLLREACFSSDPASKITLLYEEILAFVRKHQEVAG